MSRVKPDQKYLNLPKHNSETTQASKLIRIKSPNSDYSKATSLSSWLFLKYDMTYKQFQNKSKNRREQLRQEYLEDTKEAREKAEKDKEKALEEYWKNSCQ
jgi:hypothetical protein